MKKKYLVLISFFLFFSLVLTGCTSSGTDNILNGDSSVDIESVKSISSNGVIEVEFGTSKTSALPSMVSVVLSNGKEVEILVKWTDGVPTYNGDQAGTYEFIGFFDLTYLNYDNPKNITVSVEVIVNSPEKGSKNNPAQIGDVISSSFEDILEGQINLTMKMTDIISGDSAWTMIKNSNQFNDEPATNQEYIIVEYNINLKSVEYGPYSINYFDFDAVSKNGVVYNEFFSVVLDNKINTDLYSGAELTGYVVYLVDKNDEPYGVFNRKDEGEIWFDISQ
jgi:hypothetical protein